MTHPRQSLQAKRHFLHHMMIAFAFNHICKKKGSQSKYFSRSGYTSVSNSITLLFDTLNLFFAAVYIICLQGLKIVPITAAEA